MRPKIAASPAEKAYARGYTAGKKRERRTHETVYAALRQQVDYWRDRYLALRDSNPPSERPSAERQEP